MSTALDQTMGALLMGTLTGGILWGVSCSQVYYYYTRYSKDSLGVKLLVFAVWLSDTAHQGLITHSVYWYLITEYGKPASLFLLTKTIIIEMLFNGITGFLVQGFFVHRIWKLSEKRLWLVLPVASMVLAELIASIMYMATAINYTSFAELAQVKGLSVSMNVFAAVGDVLIAAILCTILHQSRTSFSRSNTLINKLMVFAVNTGLLTSICACISLITFWALPNTFVYITFYFLIGRLYANSLMATLNARKSLQAHSTGDRSLSLRDLPGGTTTGTPYSVSKGGRDGIAIRIDTTKESRREGEMDFDSATDNFHAPRQVGLVPRIEC
ncbi:hypothetical protein C8Q74DRAFT_1362770 [Fomes fomentarius]|nr:hypothetical protein C8Q74DRAFT_1362770 [Fomes fomentarius]